METNKLPIGVADFKVIRDAGLYYVDKTKFIYELTRTPWTSKFLSRPRRFGKSLLLDTIKCLYEGKEDLFQGLYIYDKWDWSKEYPVIKLDLSNAVASTYEKFVTNIMWALQEVAEEHDAVIRTDMSVGGALASLINTVSRKNKRKKVVLLIDEYDAPICVANDDTLGDNTKNEIPKEELLRIKFDIRDLFRKIKACRDIIEFVMVTGILNFGQAELFSAGNIFEDISLDQEYNDICGYTEKEFLNTFALEFERNDLPKEITLENMRDWYDGYRWTGKDRLYNPNDVLYTLRKKRLGNWWTKFGLSTLAIEKIKERGGIDLEHCVTSVTLDQLEEGVSLSEFELEKILFQTGYLTITSPYVEVPSYLTRYELGVPNFEVRASLALLDLYAKLECQPKEGEWLVSRVGEALQYNNFEALKSAINSFFAKLVYDEKPHQIKEADFSRLMKALFMGAGYRPLSEVHTDRGRIDMVIEYNGTYYLMEFKVLGKNTTGAAMEQILDREYAARYLHDGRVFLLGFEFTSREIAGKEGKSRVSLENLECREVTPE